MLKTITLALFLIIPPLSARGAAATVYLTPEQRNLPPIERLPGHSFEPASQVADGSPQATGVHRGCGARTQASAVRALPGPQNRYGSSRQQGVG